MSLFLVVENVAGNQSQPAYLCCQSCTSLQSLKALFHTYKYQLYTHIHSFFLVLFWSIRKIIVSISNRSCTRRANLFGCCTAKELPEKPYTRGARFLRAVFSHASPGHSLNLVNSVYISYFLSLNCLSTLLIYSEKIIVLLFCFYHLFSLVCCLRSLFYSC